MMTRSGIEKLSEGMFVRKDEEVRSYCATFPTTDAALTSRIELALQKAVEAASKVPATVETSPERSCELRKYCPEGMHRANGGLRVHTNRVEVYANNLGEEFPAFIARLQRLYNRQQL